jgi:hypothetical protein
MARFVERQITFGYDFRMRCNSCGQTSILSGADYIRLDNENDAHMECDHCDDSIHFGPLAAGIRDQNDPALDDGMLSRFSWYHSSPYANWPNTDCERDMKAMFSTSRARALMGDPEPYLQAQLDKALHLGTYEAAIENVDVDAMNVEGRVLVALVPHAPVHGFLTSSRTSSAGTKSPRRPRNGSSAATASPRNSRTPSSRTSCQR